MLVWGTGKHDTTTETEKWLKQMLNRCDTEICHPVFSQQYKGKIPARSVGNELRP
jgi:hypothetical protein